MSGALQRGFLSTLEDFYILSLLAKTQAVFCPISFA